ncbi:hypothetical protein [Candidatus Magnetobacterium casense]|uniref:Uncharacterized protein n=1 Tax=Candidatus Magnetobacterium casense TaxID=1455061 RepID=A0ABS6S0H3_9BACT|nr:hypothetical protein [Candidatus Magnetobacterium casensis]MBV6342344.1 hypothetical protein [Candidatus Magnetobacterium casensis]
MKKVFEVGGVFAEVEGDITPEQEKEVKEMLARMDTARVQMGNGFSEVLTEVVKQNPGISPDMLFQIFNLVVADFVDEYHKTMESPKPKIQVIRGGLVQ